jgi:hypothetical protein
LIENYKNKNMSMGSTRTVDRLIGVFVTISGGLVVLVVHKWLRKIIAENRLKSKQQQYNNLNNNNNKNNNSQQNGGDESYKARYKKNLNTTIHHGSCHCQRVRFRLHAPKILQAVDIPSKIRFPRISLCCDQFEPLTDETLMSIYAVKPDNEQTNMGIHTFCSYCGMHIIYAPSTEPIEIQINADCLDRSTIEKINVSYHAIGESYPCPISYEPARAFNKRGTGSGLNPVLDSYMPGYLPTRSSSPSHFPPSSSSSSSINKQLDYFGIARAKQYIDECETNLYRGYSNNNNNNNNSDAPTSASKQYQSSLPIMEQKIPPFPNSMIQVLDSDGNEVWVENIKQNSRQNSAKKEIINYNIDNNSRNNDDNSMFSKWANSIVGDSPSSSSIRYQEDEKENINNNDNYNYNGYSNNYVDYDYITENSYRGNSHSSPLKFLTPPRNQTRENNNRHRSISQVGMNNNFGMHVNTPMHRQLRQYLKHHVKE